MRTRVLLAGVLALTLLGPARADDDSDRGLSSDLSDVLDMEQELVDTAATVRKMTVAVWNKRYPRGRDGKPVDGAQVRPYAFGSGVIVERASRLWVITNVHVVAGADVVTISTSDGQERAVEVHDTIPQYDIALLAFPRRPKDLDAFTLNPNRVRASKVVEEGAWVLATGNPFGLALDGHPVVTLGVLSGRDRILGGEFLYGNALQHDAEVNPGNSGGPLWNRKGDLLGINGMIATRPSQPGAGHTNTGASFSIPIHQVNAFLMALIESRTDASAGYLGLELQTSVGEHGSPEGAAVAAVAPDGPAGPKSKRPLRVGDVIVSIWGFGEDHRIRTASDVTNLLSLCREGTFLRIKFRRGRLSYEWSGRLPAAPKGLIPRR